jgi:hypothetical protein
MVVAGILVITAVMLASGLGSLDLVMDTVGTAPTRIVEAALPTLMTA